jgi:hypothetical protein
MDYYWCVIVFAATAGWSLKVLEKVVQINETSAPITMRGYLSEDRYRVAISVIGTVVMVIALHSLGQLNFAMAAACGYVGESAGRFIKKMSDQRI